MLPRTAFVFLFFQINAVLERHVLERRRGFLRRRRQIFRRNLNRCAIRIADLAAKLLGQHLVAIAELENVIVNFGRSEFASSDFDGQLQPRAGTLARVIENLLRASLFGAKQFQPVTHFCEFKIG